MNTATSQEIKIVNVPQGCIAITKNNNVNLQTKGISDCAAWVFFNTHYICLIHADVWTTMDELNTHKLNNCKLYCYVNEINKDWDNVIKELGAEKRIISDEQEITISMNQQPCINTNNETSNPNIFLGAMRLQRKLDAFMILIEEQNEKFGSFIIYNDMENKGHCLTLPQTYTDRFNKLIDHSKQVNYPLLKYCKSNKLVKQFGIISCDYIKFNCFSVIVNKNI